MDDLLVVKGGPPWSWRWGHGDSIIGVRGVGRGRGRGHVLYGTYIHIVGGDHTRFRVAGHDSGRGDTFCSEEDAAEENEGETD